MRKFFAIIIVLVSISSLAFAQDGKKYGKDLTVENTTKISEILANPASFEGKKVKVEGTIVSVCATRGCWMEIAGDKEFEKIKVKVKDGEIVFPLEAKGKTAVVEGELYSFGVKDPQCSGDDHKHKDEKASCDTKDKADKKSCDSNVKEDKESCDHKEKEKKVYQLKGLGAVIK